MGASITYRIAVGPQRGEKAFLLRTLPPADEDTVASDQVARVSGFSLHAGIAARADQRKKLERLCRYVSRPAVAEPRLSLTDRGEVRYTLKSPFRDGTTHVVFQPLEFMTLIERILRHVGELGEGGAGLAMAGPRGSPGQGGRTFPRQRRLE